MNAVMQIVAQMPTESMSDEDVPPRHTPHSIIEWLHKKARQNGHTAAVLARELGVTYGYLSQLSQGMREMHNTSACFARSCAVYLDVPAVAVMLVAGQIKPNDFVFPSGPGPLVDPLSGAEISDASSDVQALLTNLYRDAVGQKLLAPKRLPMLLKELQEGAFVVAEIEAKERAKDWAAAYGVDWQE